MTNYEHYKDELIKISCFDHLAKEKNVVTRCGKICCVDCDFNADAELNCTNKREKWLDEEYVEAPAVDWSKVAVDTKIYVKKEDDDRWIPRYFAKYENGKVFAFIQGGTSFSQRISQPIKYAKLAEEEC